MKSKVNHPRCKQSTSLVAEHLPTNNFLCSTMFSSNYSPVKRRHPFTTQWKPTISGYKLKGSASCRASCMACRAISHTCLHCSSLDVPNSLRNRLSSASRARYSLWTRSNGRCGCQITRPFSKNMSFCVLRFPIRSNNFKECLNCGVYGTRHTLWFWPRNAKSQRMIS